MRGARALKGLTYRPKRRVRQAGSAEPSTGWCTAIIKPENILLHRATHALVADFGIARALRGGADER